jgi:hypothetical protein
MADEPRSVGVANRTPAIALPRLRPVSRPRVAPLLALPVAAALLGVWLIAYPRTPDLAAQVYRVGLFRQLGFAVWDEHWYAGHHLPGYSLLFPPLASLLGLRLVAVLSVLASATLFERVAVSSYGAGARWGAAWFAIAAVGDVWSGRLAFALGVSLALGAVLAFLRERLPLAVALAAACGAASPVAGLLLALAGVTHALWKRSWRGVLALAGAPAAVVALLAVPFPEGGVEPYPLAPFAATVLVVFAFLWALPPGQPLLRLGAYTYLAACVACLLVHTPVGSNIERYAVLLAGPLLACALAAHPARRGEAHAPTSPGGSAGAGTARRGHLPLAGAVLLGIALWVAWGPVRETLAVAGNRSTTASYYAPVERFLAAHAPAPVRIEVPLTRAHWEAALLAPTVSLARGWEKQLDTRFDRVLLAPRLTAAAYERWLRDQAVSYVALPDTPLDPSSAREGRLIRRGLPYLREVFASEHWRIYAVLSATPLVRGPGRLETLGHDSFLLRAFAPGRFLVRVRFTRYWTLVRGNGCVGPAQGGWTSVTVGAPEAVGVIARFSLSRALGLGGPCRVARPS